VEALRRGMAAATITLGASPSPKKPPLGLSAYPGAAGGAGVSGLWNVGRHTMDADQSQSSLYEGASARKNSRGDSGRGSSSSKRKPSDKRSVTFSATDAAAAIAGGGPGPGNAATSGSGAMHNSAGYLVKVPNFSTGRYGGSGSDTPDGEDDDDGDGDEGIGWSPFVIPQL
jgi:hypothetical protein